MTKITFQLSAARHIAFRPGERGEFFLATLEKKSARSNGTTNHGHEISVRALQRDMRE